MATCFKYVGQAVGRSRRYCPRCHLFTGCQSGQRMVVADAFIGPNQIIRILAHALVIVHHEHAFGGAGGKQDIAIFMVL